MVEWLPSVWTCLVGSGVDLGGSLHFFGETMSESNKPYHQSGLSAKQWVLLAASFLLGVVCVFALREVFPVNQAQASTGTAHVTTVVR